MKRYAFFLFFSLTIALSVVSGCTYHETMYRDAADRTVSGLIEPDQNADQDEDQATAVTLAVPTVSTTVEMAPNTPAKSINDIQFDNVPLTVTQFSESEDE